MTSRRVLFGITGPLWIVCGVVIGLSPPVSDGRYARGMPLVGWAIAALGALILVKAIRESDHWGEITWRGRPWERIKSIGLVAIVVALGGWSLWQGISTWLPSALCIGVVLLSVVPMLLPRSI